MRVEHHMLFENSASQRDSDPKWEVPLPLFAWILVVYPPS